jgi:type II secretion system protein N
MNRRSVLFWLAAAIACLVTLPPLTLLFIPDSVIRLAVSQALASNGITVHAAKIGTTLPFGIRASKLAFANTATSLITLDRFSLQLRPLSLLSGNLSFNVTANVGTGTINGTITLLPHLQGLLQINMLELADIPLLATASGGTMRGTAQIDLSLQPTPPSGSGGEARLLIRNIQVKGVRISSVPLPDASFPELRGIVKIKGQTVVVDNLALQGNGIYLRLGGTAPLTAGAPLNLNLELMPNAEFLEQQKSVFLFMIPYQVSPGHYALPISGTLTSPQLAGR